MYTYLKSFFVATEYPIQETREQFIWLKLELLMIDAFVQLLKWVLFPRSDSLAISIVCTSALVPFEPVVRPFALAVDNAPDLHLDVTDS